MTLLKKKLDSLPIIRHSFDDFNTRDIFLRNKSKKELSLPPVNITETSDAFLIEMVAPGLQKKDFLIEFENEILKISAHKENQNKSGGLLKSILQEYDYSSFERTFYLSKAVIDDTQIKAEYKSGILKIYIAKKEEAKALPPRNILVT